MEWSASASNTKGTAANSHLIYRFQGPDPTWLDLAASLPDNESNMS